MTEDSTNGIRLNRREALLLSAAAGMGIALAPDAHASDSIKTGVHQEPGNCSTPRSAVAKTQYGKVRGFLDGGRVHLQGHSLRPGHGRREPLAAGEAAGAVEG